MVNKLKFTVTSSFDGLATYFIYEGLGCSGSTISYSGTTEIVDGVSEVEVNNITISEELSVKVIDSKNCEACNDQTISIAVCTPFSGTASYVEPEVILYYVLNACDPEGPSYSVEIEPLLANQIYIDPLTNDLWVWNNADPTTSLLQPINNSLQLVSGQSGCP